MEDLEDLEELRLRRTRLLAEQQQILEELKNPKAGHGWTMERFAAWRSSQKNRLRKIEIEIHQVKTAIIQSRSGLVEQLRAARSAVAALTAERDALVEKIRTLEAENQQLRSANEPHR